MTLSYVFKIVKRVIFLKARFQKVVSFFVVVSLSFSLVAFPSYAFTVSAELVAKFASGLNLLYQELTGIVDFSVDWLSYMEFPQVDLVDSYKEFMDIVFWYNSGGFCGRAGQGYLEGLGKYEVFMSGLQNAGPRAIPKSDPAFNGIYRLYDVQLKCWVVDSNGQFPYISREVFNAGLQGEDEDTYELDVELLGKWCLYRDVEKAGKVKFASSKDKFYEIVARVINLAGGGGARISTFSIGSQRYLGILQYRENYPPATGYVWCDIHGIPICWFLDDDSQAVTQPWSYNEVKDVNSDHLANIDNLLAENNKMIIDTIKGEFNLPIDLTVNPSFSWDNSQSIDSLTYDFDNRTYTVNTYDYTYYTTNNNEYYEFNYNTYEVQYTYNNTYVSYIGSTAEYQPKEWAFYYELPDGRSSADLTEEDIAGLSFQFSDMVNYKQSATDTSLRALYHFDGNTEDSSFWSAQGDFTWGSNASITYKIVSY